MLDIGFSELLLFAIVALVVLGPEKLPHATRMAGAWLGRIRRTVADMQAEIEKEVAVQELRDRLRKDIAAAENSEVKKLLEEQLSTLNPPTNVIRQAPDATILPPETFPASTSKPISDGEQQH